MTITNLKARLDLPRELSVRVVKEQCGIYREPCHVNREWSEGFPHCVVSGDLPACNYWHLHSHAADDADWPDADFPYFPHLESDYDIVSTYYMYYYIVSIPGLNLKSRTVEGKRRSLFNNATVKANGIFT